jgi:hypothetical protein
MKKIIVILIMLMMASSQVYAQKKISYIGKGQQAKYDGVLLSPEAFAELQIEGETNEQHSQAILAKEKELLELKYKYLFDNEKIVNHIINESLKKQLELEKQHANKLETELLEKSQETPAWYNEWRMELGFVSGFAVTLLSFYVFTAAVNQ